ncbi:hypothetical protein HDU98_003029 [Podochytrium sp. JEL0797]|nr:hypothetical protein HDU98_003029 [Podochytrium sp. JEL0797]
MLTASVSPAEANTPLHQFIRTHASLRTLVPSRSQAHAAFKLKQVSVNGKIAPEGLRLQPGDIVCVDRTALAKDKQDGVRRIHCAPTWAVCFKASGVSMDARSPAFVTAVQAELDIDQAVKVVPAVVVDKNVSGLVVLNLLRDQGAVANLAPENVECVYRCIVMGKVGHSTGLREGNEFVIESTLQNTTCRTKICIVSFTGSRNSPDGFLTTLEATPIAGFIPKQVLAHLHFNETPVIGNSRLTISHRTCRDKGIFLSLISVSFPDPSSSDHLTVLFTHPEPTKFEALRAKEFKFYDRKRTEIEQALGEAQDDSNDESIAAETTTLPPRLDSTTTPLTTQFKNPAYILGHTTFHSLPILVSPSVMIPRQSSTILVDTVTHLYLTSTPSPLPAHIHVLDMGTGSGSLLLATVKQLSADPRCAHVRVSGTGMDLSANALEVARRNIAALGVGERVGVRQGRFGDVVSLFSGEEEGVVGPVQIVLCNPPYLTPRTKPIQNIDMALLDEEPRVALYGDGKGGVEAYREIGEGVVRADGEVGERGFARGCVMVVEIGHGMGERVGKVLEEVGMVGAGKLWELVGVERDARRLERCILLKKR